jgi:16S rRNA (uracil1498-N3)-methyltransferase
VSLIASTQADALHLKKILTRFETEHEARPMEVTVLIGPEGDFTPAEYGNASEAGFQAITLGPIILRVETAAIFCLSVLSYELLGTEY